MGCSVCFITRNRTEKLRRVLCGVAEAIGESELVDDLTIADDSSDLSAVENTRALSNELAERLQIPVTHLSPVENQVLTGRLLERSAARGVSREAIEFAFDCGPELAAARCSGGNRNAALLAAAGRRIVTIDDDAEYRFSRLARSGWHTALRSQDLGLEIGHFGSEKLLTRHLEPCPDGGIRALAGILGQDALSVLEAHGAVTDPAEGAASPALRGAIKDSRSSVRAVMSGIAGGRWYSRPFAILATDGPLRRDSLKPRRAYEAAKQNPHALMQAPELTITDNPFFVTCFAGIDARRLVPPFPPAGRPEDWCWAALLRVCDPNALLAHVPFVIHHDADDKVAFNESDYAAVGADLGLMTMLAVNKLIATIPALEEGAALEAAGRRFVELSRLGQRSRLEYCQLLWLEYVGSVTAHYEGLLEKHRGRPKHWAAGVRAYLARLQEQAVRPEAALPRELDPWSDREEAGRRQQLFFRRYGELLASWPEIWKAALEIGSATAGAATGTPGEAYEQPRSR